MNVGDIIIDVRGGRAIVSQWRILKSGEGPVSAANASELEEDAAQAVEGMGGYLTLSGQYPCPCELAERATWGGRPARNAVSRFQRKTITLPPRLMGAIEALQKDDEDFSSTLQRLLGSHPAVAAVIEHLKL